MFATFQVLGQVSAGFISDWFGRRVSLYLVIFWAYIGVMLEVISKDWRMWTGSKIVIGYATGMMQSTVPTYVAEVAPRECRAIGLSFSYLCMTFGSLLSTLVTYGTNLKWGADINDDRAFRVPLYIGLAVPTLVLIFELFILVESPSWLIMRGKRDKARSNLAYIHSWQKDFDLERAFAEPEYTLQKEAEQSELESQSSYLDCFKGVDLRRTFCAVFPPMTNNLAGSNLTGQYATYFFEIAGSNDPLVNSVITTIVGLLANVATFFTIETKSVGRWGLLLGGLITMTASMLAIGLIAEITHGVYSYASGVVLTFFVALFSAASTLGPGFAGFAYTGESGSSRLRAKTTTLGVVGNALVGLIMTTCLPYMLNATTAGGRGWGIKTGMTACFFLALTR
ncbi:hypothetical protein JCM24511_04769 [Saitozyma sp. JCM 24511]|nr:hypothetical protein JCM24511_04769 [Saitozyma sp. JCM 24511]